METKIIERVRRLLELAKSDNVNEASNAAKQAQILMSRHAISEAMLETRSPEEQEAIDVELLYTHDKSKLPTWRGRLGVVLGEVNQCEVYRSGSNLKIIGRPSDAHTVRYLFSYLCREIERLCDTEAALRGAPGITWRNNFRIGAVQAVAARLKEAFKEARAAMKQEADISDILSTGAALARVNTALATLDKRREDAVTYGREKLKLRKTTRRFTKDTDGLRAGERAGKSINLDGTRAGLGAGSRKYLES